MNIIDLVSNQKNNCVFQTHDKMDKAMVQQESERQIKDSAFKISKFDNNFQILFKIVVISSLSTIISAHMIKPNFEECQFTFQFHPRKLLQLKQNLISRFNTMTFIIDFVESRLRILIPNLFQSSLSQNIQNKCSLIKSGFSSFFKIVGIYSKVRTQDLIHQSLDGLSNKEIVQQVKKFTYQKKIIFPNDVLNNINILAEDQFFVDYFYYLLRKYQKGFDIRNQLKVTILTIPHKLDKLLYELSQRDNKQRTIILTKTYFKIKSKEIWKQYRLQKIYLNIKAQIKKIKQDNSCNIFFMRYQPLNSIVTKIQIKFLPLLTYE